MRIHKIGEKHGFMYVLSAGIRPDKQIKCADALKRLNGFPGVSVQVLNPDALAGEVHIITASRLAARAWARGEKIARSQATEFLLYASAERQIKSAIAGMGISKRSTGWVVIALSDSIENLRSLGDELSKFGEEDDSLIDLTEEKITPLKKQFKIDDDEISIAERINATRMDAITSLVLERVALSDLYR